MALSVPDSCRRQWWCDEIKHRKWTLEPHYCDQVSVLFSHGRCLKLGSGREMAVLPLLEGSPLQFLPAGQHIFSDFPTSFLALVPRKVCLIQGHPTRVLTHLQLRTLPLWRATSPNETNLGSSQLWSVCQSSYPHSPPFPRPLCRTSLPQSLLVSSVKPLEWWAWRSTHLL